MVRQVQEVSATVLLVEWNAAYQTLTVGDRGYVFEAGTLALGKASDRGENMHAAYLGKNGGPSGASHHGRPAVAGAAVPEHPGRRA